MAGYGRLRTQRVKIRGKSLGASDENSSLPFTIVAAHNPHKFSQKYYLPVTLSPSAVVKAKTLDELEKTVEIISGVADKRALRQTSSSKMNVNARHQIEKQFVAASVFWEAQSIFSFLVDLSVIVMHLFMHHVLIFMGF
ncbi:hypothetical protein AVEN_103624-1 [Araneus ventricosus]|uniref:Uncharacterized protein n=1 Tax=Araneus ventricosus TaxID=182803 RepID=A0A4Y2UII7_ARAVE|nr:hypothetical protein AVEN_103624-1 [Araneus ventricosus]